ncbi:hypothetical protein, partial [Ruthenibacterium lactatiformans]
ILPENQFLFLSILFPMKELPGGSVHPDDIKEVISPAINVLKIKSQPISSINAQTIRTPATSLRYVCILV